MRKFVLRLALLTGIVCMVGACADSPTAGSDQQRAPDHAAPVLDTQVEGCVIGGTCTLEPISGGGCDEWDYSCDDGGGDCAASTDPGSPDGTTVQGCDGGGGNGGGYDGGGGGSGGGGGAGGTKGPMCPDTGCASEPPPSDTCRTGEAIVDDLDVYGVFDSLWQQSLADGVEMGGWIVRDGFNNYRLIPFQNAMHTPCGVDIFEAPPANLVSMFHTHPWTLGQVRVCDGSSWMYTGTPSPEDVQALQQLGLSAGYFIDHTGVARYTATGGEKAIRIARCGY